MGWSESLKVMFHWHFNHILLSVHQSTNIHWNFHFPQFVSVSVYRQLVNRNISLCSHCTQYMLTMLRIAQTFICCSPWVYHEEYSETCSLYFEHKYLMASVLTKFLFVLHLWCNGACTLKSNFRRHFRKNIQYMICYTSILAFFTKFTNTTKTLSVLLFKGTVSRESGWLGNLCSLCSILDFLLFSFSA